MDKVNYKKLFAVKKRLEGVIKKACPNIKNTSGIYFYTRKDEDGKYCYIGKAKHLIDRNVSHLQNYSQHIDISLKKRGFMSDENKGGWNLNVLYFPEHQLDEKESYYIEKYINAGWQVYNIESGGTTGKTIIGDRKPPKGYRDGIKQGAKTLRKQLKDLLDKYLVVSVKKDGKIAQNALKKFISLLNEEE